MVLFSIRQLTGLAPSNVPLLDIIPDYVSKLIRRESFAVIHPMTSFFLDIPSDVEKVLPPSLLFFRFRLPCISIARHHALSHWKFVL
jgi:hypothetical protein